MRKEVVLWSCVALMVFGSMSLAGDQRPYVGVSLDSTPLPALLAKHLRLDPGQGIRITNIMIDGPADKARLERDDILVAFQGQKVTSIEQFVGAVRKAGAGAQVSLEVIHLGQRQTVPLKLEPVPEPEPKSVPWKYPPEPDAVTSWRPGKIFKIGPDGQEMLEIPFDKIPEISIELKQLLKDSYTYHHVTGGEAYTITIEGDPTKEDSRLIIHAGDKEYSTTLGALDSLPEKYRGPAREAVEDSRTSVEKDVRIRRFQLPEAFGPEARRKFFQSIPRPEMERLSEQKNIALERLQGQMERLQQRMKELEAQNREMLDKLLQKSETKKSKSEEPQTPAPSESKPKQAT